VGGEKPKRPSKDEKSGARQNENEHASKRGTKGQSERGNDLLGVHDTKKGFMKEKRGESLTFNGLK